MLSDIDQTKIVKQVTEEILKEIKDSDKTFTNDEVKQKIDIRIKEIFDTYKDKKKEKILLDDENMQKEFMNIEEVSNNLKGDNLQNTKDTSFEKFRNNNMKSSELKTNIEDNKINISSKQPEEENKDEEPEKKKFFQEISVIYKEELEDSLNCFRNALESLKLIKHTSILEKFLIFIFLAIPAILGGILTLLFILILLILWQIFIIFKIMLKMFEKVEKKLKTTISNILKKIAYINKNGGFFNKLIFSNLLYSVIMFNGLMYVLINGLMLPLRTVSEIDKIVANFLSKTIKVVTAGLKGSSELALSNMQTSALKSGKSSTKTRSSNEKKLELKQNLKSLGRKKDLLKGSKEHTEKIKEVERLRELEKFHEKETFANSLAGEHNKRLEENIAQRALNENAITKEQESLNEKSENLKTPSSSMLSGNEWLNSNMSDMNNEIVDGVIEDLFHAVANVAEAIFPSDSNNSDKTVSSPQQKVDEEARDIKEKSTEIEKNFNLPNGAVERSIQERLEKTGRSSKDSMNEEDALVIAHDIASKDGLSKQQESELAKGIFQYSEEWKEAVETSKEHGLKPSAGIEVTESFNHATRGNSFADRESGRHNSTSQHESGGRS